MSVIETSVLAHIPALPGKHRLGGDPRANIRRRVEQVSIDLAVIQDAIQEFPLRFRQVEQESKSLPAQRNGFLDPRIDLALAAKVAALIFFQSSPSIDRMRRASNKSRAALRSKSAASLPATISWRSRTSTLFAHIPPECERRHAGGTKQRLAGHVV